MRKISRFRLLAVGCVALGAAVAVLAIFGELRVAVAVLGVLVAIVAVMLVEVQRRTISTIRRAAKRPPAQIVSSTSAELAELSVQVDVMQRRLVAAIDAARLEAADRHAASRAYS